MSVLSGVSRLTGNGTSPAEHSAQRCVQSGIRAGGPACIECSLSSYPSPLTSVKVHYHIIPAPGSRSPSPVGDLAKVDHVVKPLTQKEMHKLEFESRTLLEDDDAEKLAERIRARL